MANSQPDATNNKSTDATNSKSITVIHGDLSELGNQLQVELCPLMFGVQCDLERILEVFSYGCDYRFQAFSRLWWEHEVYKLFYGKKKISHLTEWISQTLALTALYATKSFPIEKRIGAVFLLHSLYASQPEIPAGRLRIRVTKATWEDLQELLIALKLRDPIDAAFVLLKLMRTNAFDFVAHEVELFPRPSDAGNVAAALGSHEAARARADDVLNYEALVQLQSLAQSYHSVKGSILRARRMGPNPFGRSGPSSIISDPTDPSVASDFNRPAPSLASVALSESQRSLLANRAYRRSLALTSDAFLLQLQARTVELESMAAREKQPTATGRRRRLLKTRPEEQPSDADANADDANFSLFGEEESREELPEEDADVAAEAHLDDLLGLDWPEATSSNPANDGTTLGNDEMLVDEDDFREVDLGALGTIRFDDETADAASSAGNGDNEPLFEMAKQFCSLESSIQKH